MDEVSDAIDLAGGFLLGAALVAVVLLFVPAGAAQPIAAGALGILSIVGVHAAELRRGPRAADAGLAAALVCTASIPFYAGSPAPLGAIAALVAVWVPLVRRAATPLTLLAVPAFFVGARHATGADLLRGASLLRELAFFAALVAFAVFLVRQRGAQRDARWASHALAAHALALALAAFPLMDALGVTDAGVAALGLTATLAALFALGLWLRERPLVATAGSALAVAACAFAFLALGPALAALVLLCLGAALVWQAGSLRGYFGGPTA